LRGEEGECFNLAGIYFQGQWSSWGRYRTGRGEEEEEMRIVALRLIKVKHRIKLQTMLQFRRRKGHWTWFGQEERAGSFEMFGNDMPCMPIRWQSAHEALLHVQACVFANPTEWK